VDIYRRPGLHKFHVHTNMCPNVGVLRLFPSITEATVRAFLQPPMQGCVLQTYGAGNGPAARQDLMHTLKEASDRGVIIVNCTQCSRGCVSALYSVGKVGVMITKTFVKVSYSFILRKWKLLE
jgi:lysophospholipase